MVPKPRMKNREFGSRVVSREYTNKHGVTTTRYYYELPRDSNGKRVCIPLGNDKAKAALVVADLVGRAAEADRAKRLITTAYIYHQYIAWAGEEVKQGELASRTIADRIVYWRFLGPVFGGVPIRDIESGHSLPYFEARTAKTSAKKELKFLSVLCQWAIDRGLRPGPNPILGTTRGLRVNEGRKIYVTDEQMDLVRECGDQLIKDVLDLAYYCGMRPMEALRAEWADVVHGELVVRMPKTYRRGLGVKRVPVDGELADLLRDIKSRRIVGRTILADEQGRPLKLAGTFRSRFAKARDAAGDLAQHRGIVWQRFQFRDLRAKAGTDKAADGGMESARKFLGHTTETQTRAYVRAVRGELASALGRKKREK